MLSLLGVIIFTEQLDSMLVSEIAYKSGGDMDEASILPRSSILLKMQALAGFKSLIPDEFRNDDISWELEETIPVEKFTEFVLTECEVEWATDDQFGEGCGTIEGKTEA